MANPAFDDFVKQMTEAREPGAGADDSLEKLLKMFDEMEGISDEEKDKMKTDMLMQVLKATGKLGGGQSLVGTKNYTVFLVMVGLIVFVFGG